MIATVEIPMAIPKLMPIIRYKKMGFGKLGIIILKAMY
jgi:hypothetical protein